MPIPAISTLKLWGQGTGTGNPIYARAAVLQEDATGRPTLNPDLLVLTFKRRRRGDEDLEIILVTADAASALLLPMPPGLALVGIVSERELPPGALPPGVSLAVVSGVSGAREQIHEGNLLIVDPETGRVLVEPEAEEFVRLQAEREHRPRVLLGPGHVPARTQAGRTVAVWAEVRTAADVTAALEAGADGLFLLPGGDLLPGDASDSLDPLPGLIEVAEAFGGGDLILAAPFDLLDPAVVVSLAVRARVHWALVPEDLPVSLAELRQEMEQVIAELQETRQSAAMPLFAALCSSPFLPDAASGWEEILPPLDSLAYLTLPDTFDLPSLRFRLNDDLDGLAEAVALGAAGLIVSAGQVERAKDFVREQEY